MDRRSFITIAGASVAGAALSPNSVLHDLVLVLVEPQPQALPAGDMSLPKLAKQVAAMKRAYQACQYDVVIRRLPEVIERLAVASQYVAGDERRRMAGLASQAHHVAASVLLKHDKSAMASLAADRSMAAAEASEDQLMVGSSSRIVTHSLMAAGQTDAAHTYASSRANALSRDLFNDDAGSLSVYGALLLRGAVAAGNAENGAKARDLLDEADEAALRLGQQRNHEWTAFGPDNVLAHRMAVEISLGNAGTAIDYLRRTKLERFEIAERRAVICIDAARAYAQWGKHDKAVRALEAAEEISKAELKIRPGVVEVVQHIRSFGSVSAQSEIRDLVDRVGIAA